jgi:hypothetical protein
MPPVLHPVTPTPGVSSRKPGPLVFIAACLTAMAWLASTPQPTLAQAAGALEMPQRLALFLDCNFCTETFIRQELTYVDYVRDRAVANVHVLVTQENTGAGGRAQTFDLIGLGPFQGMDQSAVYTTSAGTTEAEERTGFLRTLQALLVPYLMQTAMREQVNVVIDSGDGRLAGPVQPEDDPWNHWTFEIYADGSADFESRQESFNARYGVYLNRVTEEWKIQLRPFFNYNDDRFERNEQVIRSIARRNGFTSYVVRSVSPHWSVGGFGDVFTSTFDNVDMRYRLMPAIE